MLDALVMEKLGIPAAAVLTEPFVPSGKAMALAQGFTDYPFAVIAHPIAATEEQSLEERADQVIDDVVSLLLK